MYLPALQPFTIGGKCRCCSCYMSPRFQELSSYLPPFQPLIMKLPVFSELLFVLPRTIDYVWLGQIRPTINATDYIWTNTCTPVTYDNWGVGQPSWGNGEQCVRVEMSSQTWETVQCGSSAEIFCEHTTGKF